MRAYSTLMRSFVCFVVILCSLSTHALPQQQGPLYHLAVDHLLWERYPQAQTAIGQIIPNPMGSVTIDTVTQVHGLFLKGFLFQQTGQQDSAKFYYRASQLLQSAIVAPAQLIEFYHTRGLFYYKLKLPIEGDSALANYNKGIAMSQAIDDIDNEIIFNNRKSVIKMQQGAYYDAMKLLKNCLPLLKQTKNIEVTTTVLTNIGHIYNTLALYKKALNIHYKTLKFDLSTNIPSHIITDYLNISDSHVGLGNYDSAMYYIQLAYSYSTKLEQTHLRGRVLFFKGKLHYDIDQLDSAIYNLKNSKKYYDASNSFENFRTTLLLSRCYYQQQNIKKAKQYAQESIGLNLNRKYAKKFEMQMYNGYSFAHALLGDTLQAFQAQFKYNQLYETLFNAENKSKVIESELNAELKLLQVQKELEASKAETILKNARIESIFIWILLGILCLVLLFFLYRYRLKKGHNQHLQQEILKRTKELQDKNTILEEYAFINAHKLRAPVARILGLCSLADLTKDPKETGDLMDKIQDETSDLDGIVKSITTTLEKN